MKKGWIKGRETKKREASCGGVAAGRGKKEDRLQRIKRQRKNSNKKTHGKPNKGSCFVANTRKIGEAIRRKERRSISAEKGKKKLCIARPTNKRGGRSLNGRRDLSKSKSC